MNPQRSLLAVLLTLASIAMSAFAGTASASTFTAPAGTTYTGGFEATSAKITTDGPFWFVECLGSAMEGKVESHGGVGPAVLKLSSWSFSACNMATEARKAGVLEIHSNGTVTSTGAEIVLWTPWMGTFEECIYTTKNSKFGSLTGSSSAHAVIDLGSAVLVRSGFSLVCPGMLTLTGQYTVVTPSTLVVE